MPELTDDEFDLLYGPWAPPAPEAVGDLLGELTWWIAGGWALELFSGVSRHHHDLDVCVPRADLDRVRKQLAGFHLWTAQDGALKPLSRFDQLPPEYEQLWVRRDATSPWLLDLLLQPVEAGDWVFKKDGRVWVPMERAVVRTRGIPHLAPEIALLHKAHLCRPQDEQDLAVVLPLLADDRRAWLRDALALVVPTSPWNGRV
jgi:hypothetical protein